MRHPSSFFKHLPPKISWFTHFILSVNLKKKFLVSLSSWVNFSSWVFLLVTYTPYLAFLFATKYFLSLPPSCLFYHSFLLCFTKLSTVSSHHYVSQSYLPFPFIQPHEESQVFIKQDLISVQIDLTSASESRSESIVEELMFSPTVFSYFSWISGFCIFGRSLSCFLICVLKFIYQTRSLCLVKHSSSLIILKF